MQFPAARFPRKMSDYLVLPLLCVLSITFLLPANGLAFWPFVSGQKQEEAVEGTKTSAPREEQLAASQTKEAEALHGKIKIMADELFRNLADADPENGDLANGVFVCTFVDLKKLTRTSSLGRYLAEQMMTEMQQRGFPVLELRKSQAVMVQEKRGEYGLSRDPAEIGQSVAAGAMLTGTYSQSSDSIIINARIMDNRSAKLLASATAIIPNNPLARQMLADSASARTKKAEPMYMKKLEL